MDIYEEITAFYQSVTCEKRVYGNSFLGRNLYAVKAGRGSPVGIATYALHAREYITARLAKLHFSVGVRKGSLWLLPLCNPDGALIVQKGLRSVENEETKTWLSSFPPETLRLWKANACGVDLNVNFPAEWGKGAKNVFSRGAENCVGEYPLSEKETLALKAFTEEIVPDYTVSFHTKGEEIYWRFGQTGERLQRDRRLAELLSASTGYPLKDAVGSVGGYKDWCIQTLGIPAFTLEVGKDEWTHPLDGDAFWEIADKNRFAVYDLSGRI